MPTMKEIADETGLSIATVSRALQSNGKVSEKTRQKVLLSMQKLSHQDEGVFFKGNIGLILADAENPFYHSIIRIIDRELRAEGYCLLCTITNDRASSAAYLRQLCQQGVRGIVWLNPNLVSCGTVLDELKGANIPLVQVGANIEPTLDSVAFDDELGVYTIARALFRQYCHKRILFIGPHDTKHFQGYVEACKEADLPIFLDGDIPVPNAKNQAQQICQAIEHSQPTAIITHTEYNTVETLRACQILKKRIPEDMSIIAYDDYPWMSMMEISAICHPLEELGKGVCRLLVKRIERSSKEQPPLHLMVTPHLILRESVCANR